MSRRDGRQNRRAGVVVPSLAVPQTIPGLVAWYRADKGVTGASVSAWNDSSGTGDANKNLTQATGANQPTFNASNASYGNQATITFGAGANQSLISGTWAAAQAQPLTIFAVGNAKDAAANYFLCSGTTNRVDLLQNANNGGTMFAGAALIDTLTTIAPASFMYGIFNGVSSAMGVNARTAQGSGNPGANTLADLILGNVQGLGASLQGAIAEVAIYSGVVSAGNISAFATYVTARYGIAVGA